MMGNFEERDREKSGFWYGRVDRVLRKEAGGHMEGLDFRIQMLPNFEGIIPVFSFPYIFKISRDS